MYRKFGVVVDLGCGRGYVSKYLQSDMVDQLYMCEFAEKLLVCKSICYSFSVV